MATGTVEYAASIAGLRLEPIEISNSHSAVEKIVIETQDGKQLKITFHLTDVFALEYAKTPDFGAFPRHRGLDVPRERSATEPAGFANRSRRSPVRTMHRTRHAATLS